MTRHQSSAYVDRRIMLTIGVECGGELGFQRGVVGIISVMI
jgi:hypothetical protein